MPKTRTLKEIEDAVHELAGKPRNASQIPELVDLLAAMAQVGEDPESAYEALEWIVRETGQAAVPVLLQTLQTKEPTKRAAALYLLSIMGEPGNTEIIEAAKAALQDKHDIVRETAVGTLAVMADENSISMLIEALGTNSSNDYHIVGALGKNGSPQAIDALTRLLYDENRRVSVDTVILALEQIGTHEAIKTIQAWKQSDWGKIYATQQAAFLVQSFENAPEAFWQGESSSTILDNIAPSDPETRLLVFTQSLRVPMLSGQAAQALERLGTPEALRVLEQWRNGQNSK